MAKPKGLVCWKCGHSLKDEPLPLSRLAQCRQCYADLHVCILCRYYNPQYRDGCDEPNADTVRDRETANFCHYFRPRANAHQTRSQDPNAAARAQLEALFGNSEPESPSETADSLTRRKREADQARQALDDLFKKPDSE